ncbi:MAG: hypothetical protein PHZ04_01720 [Patescibacteria group bacterium]|nr:hypothetical protein [Patescibacteria group bacterium]MDD5294947.1 hypothetical protein [Patescibacteria group bacterium]MDD5554783.1 hypothetical protein [Patescibacteria group bacterium]
MLVARKPVTKRDVEIFFDRHPELSHLREKTMEFTESLAFPDGAINCGTVEWIFPGTELVEQFFAELACPEI